jgi:hypothetical protein
MECLREKTRGKDRPQSFPFVALRFRKTVMTQQWQTNLMDGLWYLTAGLSSALFGPWSRLHCPDDRSPGRPALQRGTSHQVGVLGPGECYDSCQLMEREFQDH